MRRRRDEPEVEDVAAEEVARLRTASESRARDPRNVPGDVNSREAYIADLMSVAAWQGRASTRFLAEVWGVSTSAIDNYAAAASRSLRVPPGEREHRRAEMAAWFLGVAREALSRTSKATGLPDYRSALEAQELYGRYAGLEPKDGDDGAPREASRVVVTFEEPK